MTERMEGKKLGGRYEIISRIGGGGMAVVYKAKDLLLYRYVAIKVLNESLSNDSEFIRRFSREAQAAASLSHPNVVNVYDVGTEGHTHYIVMEYVEGPTLKEWIQQNGPLPPETVVDIASQICDGLAHAHENQIVHRDIKPHNILIGPGYRAKVTDFGIARAATSSTITQTGSVMGSVHYFSPEQARGGVIGERSDLYSLGVVMYEMVTGRLPFDADSAIAIALKHLQEPVEDPRKYAADLPDSIRNIILKALEKDPEKRFSSAKEMMQELRYALPTDWRSEPNWSVPRKEPAIPPEETSASQAPNPEEPDEQESTPPKTPSRAQERPKVGEETLTRLARLGNVSADGDKTILQRTAIWLENVQANMPWWQKVLFGLFTIAVIITLTFIGFTFAIKLFTSGGNSDPDSSIATSEAIQLDDYQGMKLEEAQSALESKGLEVEVDQSEVNGKYEPGVVHGQNPEAGESVKKGESVTLFVNPTDMIQVPDFTGQWQSRAENWGRSNGVDVSVKFWNFGRAGGRVYEQVPGPNEYMTKDQKLTIWVHDRRGNSAPPSQGGEAD